MQDIAYHIEDSKPVIHLFGRNQQGIRTETLVRDFRPYFYIPSEELHKLEHSQSIGIFTYCEPAEQTQNIYGENVTKIYTDLPGQVSEVRDIFSKTFESDVLFEKRFTVDNHVLYGYSTDDTRHIQPAEVGYVRPRVAYFDIEVLNPRGTMPSPHSVKYPIATIQFKDSFTGRKIIITNGIDHKVTENHIPASSERELFDIFFLLMKKLDPDIITGWYSNQFDLPYIIKRCIVTGVNTKRFCCLNDVRLNVTPTKKFIVKIPGRQCCDMLDYFKKLKGSESQLEDYGLKAVSASYGFPYKDYGAYIEELYEKKDWHTLLQYCENDVDALSLIDDKLHLFEFFESVKAMTGCKVEDTLYNSRIIMTYLMHMGIKPVPRKVKRVHDGFEGAFVMEPSIGLHYDVGWVDLKSLYPMIMMAYDLSPDVDKLVPKVLRHIVDKRDELRELNKSGKGTVTTKNQENVLKYLANSFYGVLASDEFPAYDETVAASVTDYGRKISAMVRQTCTDLGYKPVYGDSISGSSLIKVYSKKHGTIDYLPIEDLTKNYTSTIRNGDKDYCYLDDVWVEGIKDGKIGLFKVPYLMRHHTDKQMYRVTINNQWYIDVTEDHSLFTYLPKEKKKNLEIKDRLHEVSPIHLQTKYKNIVVRRSSIHKFVKSKKLDTKLYEYYGYHLANGSISFHKGIIKAGCISFGIDSEELLPYFNEYLVDAELIKTSMRSNPCRTGDYQYNGIEFVRSLNDAMGHAKQKRVPKFMFYETEKNICSFLRGFFTGDGSVSVTKSGQVHVTASTTIPTVIHAIRKLLYIVGIPSTVYKENNGNHYRGKPSGTYSYHIFVSDQKLFSKKIGFITSRKQSKLFTVSDYKMDTSVDWTYAQGITVEPLPQEDVYVYDLNVPESQNFFANDILCHNTDSVAFSPVLSSNEGQVLEMKLNRKLAEYSRETGALITFTLKFEKLHEVILFKKSSTKDKAAKKRYVGRLSWSLDDGDCRKLNFTGIEIKRSDQAKVLKDLLTNFLNYLFLEDDINKAMDYIRNMYRDIISGKVSPYDLSIPRGISSDDDNPWVRGREVAIKEYGHVFDPNTKVRLLYLKKREGQPKEVCIDSDFDTSRVKHLVDYKVHAEKLVKRKMESYMTSLGFSWDCVVNGQQTIDSFGGEPDAEVPV